MRLHSSLLESATAHKKTIVLRSSTGFDSLFGDVRICYPVIEASSPKLQAARMACSLRSSAGFDSLFGDVRIFYPAS